ncbi:MAG: His/Gly/Thr/Pro-type tRNA ligase C-terminal domain-containing protein, partial [Fibrobacterota bacterium]
VYADYSVKQMSSCICGANRGDYHLKNVSPARDLADLSYADFSFVDAGDICSCGAQLSSCRGIEVGQVFKLQKKYTTAMDMTFLDTNGKAQTPTMGCYGIGVGRTAAAAIEQNNDADGIIWPTEIAPFTIHVLALDPQDEMVSDLMHRVHDYFESRGVDVLLDDRKERPGVKFKDADLIGCPWQVILGKRGLKKGTVEIKERKSGEKTALAPKQLVATLEEFIG